MTYATAERKEAPEQRFSSAYNAAVTATLKGTGWDIGSREEFRNALMGQQQTAYEALESVRDGTVGIRATVIGIGDRELAQKFAKTLQEKLPTDWNIRITSDAKGYIYATSTKEGIVAKIGVSDAEAAGREYRPHK